MNAIVDTQPVDDAPQGSAVLTFTESSAPRTQPRRRMPLGEQLVEADLLTRDELEDALKLQASKGQKLGEILLELGVITEDQMLPFIHRQLGIPSVKLREGVIDPAVVRILPRDAAERLTSLAIFKVRGVLSVAMTEPENLEQLDELERITGLKVRPVFAFASNIQRMMTRAYEEDFAVDSVTADMDEAAVELQNESVELDLSSVESMVDGSPVINLVNYLILQSLRKGASDIHIEPTRKHTIVRFRVDGQLIEVLRPRRDIHAAIVSRIKVMSKMDIAEHRIPQDGRCQVAVEGMRCNPRLPQDRCLARK